MSDAPAGRDCKPTTPAKAPAASDHLTAARNLGRSLAEAIGNYTPPVARGADAVSSMDQSDASFHTNIGLIG
jgi:hypothetical protein